ncbi:transcriptional regulator [Bacillus sp. 7504-2]|nr:transcriptional regulator [Bacillus sp. 7504-2]
MENKLQKYHRETGIKQAFIAKKAKMTPGAYSQVVRGAMPTLKNAIRIARAVNMTVEEIWGDQVE